MKKKQYERPEVNEIRFSIRDALMDGEGSGGIDIPTPGSQGGSSEDPFSLKDAYQLH